MDEYKKVKLSLKLGKAAGPDGIPPEVFKLCDFDQVCLDFCNDALVNNDKPETWSFMNIVSVPKSGDLSKTDNYRGISLICIIAKIYTPCSLKSVYPEKCHENDKYSSNELSCKNDYIDNTTSDS